jgi:hypothetical protein
MPAMSNEGCTKCAAFPLWVAGQRQYRGFGAYQTAFNRNAIPAHYL